MARMKGGPNGGFSGRIGNMIGYERNGKFYVKSAYDTIKDAKSEAQLAQRMRLSLASKLAKLIKPYIQQSFKFAGRTVRGECMSNAMKGAMAGEYPNLYIDYRYLKVASGILMPANSATAEFDDSGNLLFQWVDNSGEGNAKADDRAMMLAIHPDKKQCAYQLKGAERSTGYDLISGTPASFREGEVHCYLAFMSADETMISDNSYISL